MQDKPAPYAPLPFFVNGKPRLETQREIKLIYLVSGLVLIGRVERLHSTIVLHEPFEVMVTPASKENKLEVSLIPFGSMFGALPSIEKTDIIQDTLILAEVAAKNEILAEYEIAASREFT
jgi:hypothetical protein